MNIKNAVVLLLFPGLLLACAAPEDDINSNESRMTATEKVISDLGRDYKSTKPDVTRVATWDVDAVRDQSKGKKYIIATGKDAEGQPLIEAKVVSGIGTEDVEVNIRTLDGKDLRVDVARQEAIAADIEHYSNEITNRLQKECRNQNVAAASHVVLGIASALLASKSCSKAGSSLGSGVRCGLLSGASASESADAANAIVDSPCEILR